MSEIRFDAQKLIQPLNDLTRLQIPNAAVKSLNKAVFEAQQRLRVVAEQEFNNPVPFTLNSFKYDKPTRDGETIRARVFIREDAPKGNAPSRYLNPQIRGGPSNLGRFQVRMTNTISAQPDGRTVQVRPRGSYLVPVLRKSNGVRINRYGNMSPGQYTEIVSALSSGLSSSDLDSPRSLRSSSSLRSSRKTWRPYIFLDQETIDNHDYFRNRFSKYYAPGRGAGIYQVRPAGGGQPTRFYKVFSLQGRIPGHSPKFEFFDEAATTVSDVFVRELRKNILR
jgi:hypothetical protein